MFCHECGTENSESAKFCKNCGTQLHNESLVTQEPTESVKIEPEVHQDSVKEDQRTVQEPEVTNISHDQIKRDNYEQNTSTGNKNVLWIVLGIFLVAFLMFFMSGKKESDEIQAAVEETISLTPSRSEVISLVKEADRNDMIKKFQSGAELKFTNAEVIGIWNYIDERWEGINHNISDFKEVSSDQVSPELRSYLSGTNKVYEAVVTSDVKAKMSYVSNGDFIDTFQHSAQSDSDKRSFMISGFVYSMDYMFSEFAKGKDTDDLSSDTLSNETPTLSFEAGQIIKVPHKEGEDRYQFVRDINGTWRCACLASKK